MTDKTMFDRPLLLQNASYYSAGEMHYGHLLLADGKVAAIYDELPPDMTVDADFQRYDATGRLVLPGCIDTHVHVREPGSPEKEDFLTGTAAALSAGVTTICQMPNVNPIPHDVASLEVTRQAAANKALCNVAGYAAAGADNTREFAALARAGICGLKTFLQPGKSGEPQYITVAQDDGDAELCALLAAGKSAGLRCFFHCEDYALIGKLEQQAHESGQENYSFHYKTRPNEAELNAVSRVLAAAAKTGAKVGIVHVSTVAAAEAISAAKRAGADVTCEVCFHHLFFDDSWLDKFGPYAKCNPPLRSKADVEGLWRFVNDGTVDYLGSDHAPHLLRQKQAGEKHIWLAPSGVAHMEIMLPLLLSAVKSGKLKMERLAELISENGYKAMGLYPQKGCITTGADADLTVIDTDVTWRFDHRQMQTKAREACRLFDGMEMTGRVEAAIVKGRLVYADGIVDYQSAGWGDVLTCHKNQWEGI